MNKKQKIIVANFKMNLVSRFSVTNWFRGLSKYEKELKEGAVELVLCPPLLHASLFLEKTADFKSVSVGLQDCFWEKEGSYTGGVSPLMGKNFGLKYVIIGHSERRRYFGETDEQVTRKLNLATEVGLKGVLCLGENLEEKKKELTDKVLLEKLGIYLKDYPAGRLDKLLIAYEPVWAISANKPTALPDIDEIMMARLIIKKFLVQKYGERSAKKVRILYGGSVSVGNVEDVCYEARMDGVLVGKGSLVAEELMGILQKAKGDFSG